MLLLVQAFRWTGGVCAALLLLAGLAQGRPAQAATVYTYAFEQTGFTLQLDPTNNAGKLSGTFSGTLDTFGRISLSTLTDFHLEISGFTGFADGLNGSAISIAKTFFDYSPGDNSSFALNSLLVNANSMQAIIACVGLPVGLSCGGGAARGFIYAAFSGAAFTSSAMHVTLVATTPIPAGLPLLATALLGLGAVTLRRRPAAPRLR
jgi:hypothetical protein